MVAQDSFIVIPDISKDGGTCGALFGVYDGRLPALPEGSAALTLMPTAAAMLRLAPALLANGQARPADQALPLYVRDKVALTTDERAQAKQAAQHAAAA